MFHNEMPIIYVNIFEVEPYLNSAFRGIHKLSLKMLRVSNKVDKYCKISRIILELGR